MGTVTNRLSENEVRERLKSCSDSQVLDEIYTFGQMMLKETVANLRFLESKAASMAAYGGAVVTLLVSTAGAWSKLGNIWTLCFAAIAGGCAFGGAFFAAKAMALRDYEWIGESEWLHEECLAELEKLKKYRVLTLWGAMDSHKTAHLSKALILKKSQHWLSVSVLFILVMLLHIAWAQGPSQYFWTMLCTVI